jgi:hypothetical protein
MAAFYIYLATLAFFLIGFPNVLAYRHQQPVGRRVTIFLLTFLPNSPVLVASLVHPLTVLVLQFDPIAWLAWYFAMRLAGARYFDRQVATVHEAGPQPIAAPLPSQQPPDATA